MKKLLFLLVTLFFIQANVKADNDKLIQFTQLPQQAQKLVKSHFDKSAISVVKMESGFFDKSYEVIFSNGDKLDFDKSGNWKEIDCRYGTLPQAVVPVAIRNYISKNYPDAKVVKIEKEDRGQIEVGLSNQLDITFDSKFNVIDIDN